MGVFGTAARVVAGVATAGISEAVIRVSARMRKADGTEDDKEDAPMADPIPAPAPVPTPIPTAPVAPSVPVVVAGIGAKVQELKSAKDAAEARAIVAEANAAKLSESLKAVTGERDAQAQLATAQAGRAAQAEAAFRDAESKRQAAESRAIVAETELATVKQALGM